MGQDTQIGLLEDKKLAGKNEVEKKHASRGVLVLMDDPETAIAIITCEGAKEASLCEFCLQHETSCCPLPGQGAVHSCSDGYRFNQDFKLVEEAIRTPPTS